MDLNYNKSKCGKLHEYGAKVNVVIHANCCTNCYCEFNLCGIFENMTSLTPIFNQELEQGKLMAALNSRK